MKPTLYATSQALRLLDGSQRGWRRLTVWAALAGFALVLGVILRATPASLEATAEGTRILGWPLESTFTLSTLLVAVLCFRAWERMFPAELPSVYSLYPLRSLGVVHREIRLVAIDMAGMFLTLCAWLLPSWVSVGRTYVGYAAFYALLASLVAGLLAFAVAPLFVRMALREVQGGGAVAPSRTAVMAAPAAAFGLAIALLLVLKLGTEELARSFEIAPLVTSLKNLRGAEAVPLPKASIYAIGLPLLMSVGLFIAAAPLRVRTWLRDAVRVSAATMVTPDLSYAWIQTESLAHGKHSPVALLVRRDSERVRRSAPFRLLGALMIALLATLMVLVGAPLTRWIGLIWTSAWVLAWLRVPLRVRAAWTPALRQWDSLLVSPAMMKRARLLTMMRVTAPYLLALLIPGLTFAFIHKTWVPGVFAALSAVLLIAHAGFELREERHD